MSGKIFTLITILSLLVLIKSYAKIEENKMQNSKVLIVYFSPTHTTEKLAKRLAKIAGADLFEIIPQDPYTISDLDWQNDKSRSSIEMKDMKSRPKISSKVKNFNDYTTIFIGFPIWWYREPSIIDTFIEGYDFSNKTVIPFATSGSSPLGNSGENIQKLAPEAKVLNGKRLETNISDTELTKWISQFI